ncbi:MAG: hypothetical protein QOE61_1620, partial [Micromonosporaceae bacterium]|nr:hypothetical protein [Micromonosporaceae bacterium]
SLDGENDEHFSQSASKQREQWSGA